MQNSHVPQPTVAPPSHTLPDLPLIIEQLQNQLDDLTAIVRGQQEQLARQAARISAIERA